MSDINQHTISEDMVKLIFNPLRESLTETSNSIKSSTAEIAKLVETLSNHPNKADLKDLINTLLQNIEADVSKRLSSIDIDLTTKLTDQTKLLVETTNSIKNNTDTNTDTVVTEIGNLKGLVDALVSKIDMLMIIIGITFTLSMTAWGVISFIFNFKE